MSKQEKKINLSPPFAIVAALRFFEIVYPPAAIKIAKKFFFSPIRFKRPEREMKTLEQASRQELMLGSKKITTYTWGKGDKKVLLVHGWSGRATQFFKIKNFLLSRGFQVVAFDAPAHGENKDISQTHMLEFVESIERVNMTFGPFYGAIGHSLGGLAILNAYNKGFQVEKIAVIASPCSIGNVISDFCKRIKAGPKTEKGLVAHLIATYKVPLEHYSGTEQAKTVNAQGLIVHDIHDHDVSVEEGRMLNKAWRKSKLHTTKRLGHRSILMNKETVAMIADFFGKRKDGGRPPRKSGGRKPQSEQKTNKPQTEAKAKDEGVKNNPQVNKQEEVKKKPSRPPRRKPAQKKTTDQSPERGSDANKKTYPRPAKTTAPKTEKDDKKSDSRQSKPRPSRSSQPKKSSSDDKQG